jgi:hypothetical protein
MALPHPAQALLRALHKPESQAANNLHKTKDW